MKFVGKVKEDGKFWVIEVPAFEAITQGYSEKHAYKMIIDWFESVLDRKVLTEIIPIGDGRFFLDIPMDEDVMMLLNKSKPHV